MKIKIFSALVFSGFMIMAAIFAVSFKAVPAKADDSGDSGSGEQCFTDDSYNVGRCSCKYYTCYSMIGAYRASTTRNGFGCYIGNSTTSVTGRDSSVNGGADWGDMSGCSTGDDPLSY